MSTCISREGEYDGHLRDADFICRRCFITDEEALRNEVRRVNDRYAAARRRNGELAQTVERVQRLERKLWAETEEIADPQNTVRLAYRNVLAQFRAAVAGDET